MEIKATPASFIRVLGAIIYDLIILIFGIFMVIGFIVLPIYNYFTGQESIDSGEIFLPILLCIITLLYYGLSWKISGQTIGMKSWKLFLISSEYPEKLQSPSWNQIALRVVFSLISTLFVFAGFVFILIHPHNKSAHDILSKTQIMHIPKNASKKLY